MNFICEISYFLNKLPQLADIVKISADQYLVVCRVWQRKASPLGKLINNTYWVNM